MLISALWLTACSGSEPESTPDTDEPVLATNDSETDGFDTDITETDGTETTADVALPTANLFVDGFESADMLATNNDGFFLGIQQPNVGGHSGPR